MASVDRRPNGTYRVRWREYPGAPQQTKTFSRRVDADQFRDTVAGALVAGTYVDPDHGRQTFAAFADEWATAQDWKFSTRRAWNENYRARLVEQLGDRPLASIDRLVLQAVQAALLDRLERSTVVVVMSKLRAVMRAAFDAGRITRDPTRGLRQPKQRTGDADRSVGPDQVPTRDEALAILNAAPGPYRAAIALGLAGLRIGEVLGLAADRVDVSTRTVTVDQQAARDVGGTVLTGPKNEKPRTITVPEAVAVELRRHLRDYGSDGLLWRARNGSPLAAQHVYVYGWRPALVAAGLPADRFKFHALRHFCASTLLAEGAPLTAVAGHLGDTVATVSSTYVHWLRDDRDVPAAVLDRVLAGGQNDDVAAGESSAPS